MSAGLRSSSSSRFPAANARGNLAGTSIVGAIEWYITRYGPAAAHAAIATLPPAFREYVQPNVPMMGLLGARKYPYAFVGAIVRSMAAAVRADEDAFIREIGIAGSEAALNTVARAFLRYAVSPEMLAVRAQDIWNEFHDCGRLTNTVNGQEYVTEVTEWPNHDVVVCKLSEAVCGWMFERMGKSDVEARRVKCVAWGNPSCITRVRWGVRSSEREVDP